MIFAQFVSIVSDQYRFIILTSIFSFILFITMILTIVLCCGKKKGSKTGDDGDNAVEGGSKSKTKMKSKRKKSTKPIETVEPDKYGTLRGIDDKMQDSGRKKDANKSEKPNPTKNQKNQVSSSQYVTLVIAKENALKDSGRKKKPFTGPKTGIADAHDYDTMMGLDNKMKSSKRG